MILKVIFVASKQFFLISKRNFSTGLYNTNKNRGGTKITTQLTTLPGFCDVHVHLREPGFSYKETIHTGTIAAAHGGFTDICAMSNLNPVPDSKDNLQIELNIINKNAVINVYPYASITINQKGEELTPNLGTIAYSDDGVGVQSAKLMQQAMETKNFIVAHCEDNGQPSPREAEYKQIERDLELAAKTNAKYHVCHISTKESVNLIREAKKEHINVTCETAPHYLTLNKNIITNEGKYQMNPPIHEKQDQEALIEGIQDGTIDMIATDHAPHSAEEKLKGINGITGIELAFPVLYTKLVKENIISLNQLIKLMADNPRKRFNIKTQNNTYTEWDLNTPFIVDPRKLLSKGKCTPFEGWELYGINNKTVIEGRTVWQKEKI